MTTRVVLLFLILICNTIFAQLYRIASFDDINQTNLRNNVCYMTNKENDQENRWCELVSAEVMLPTIKQCVSINGSLPNLDDSTTIDEWIDRSIARTNCSYFRSSSMTKTQKRILTIIQAILLLIVFFPFILEFSLTIIRYCFY